MTDSKKTRWSPAKIVVMILFWGIAASMVYSSFRLSKRRAAIVSENETIAEEVTNVREEVQRLKSLRSESQAAKDLTKEMIGLCREAVDVPNFNSWIVSSSRGGNGLKFFVPEGEHSLLVTISLLSSSAKNPLPFPSVVQKRIRLEPNAGYKFEIADRARGEPLRWTLESNAPSFETIETRLPYRADWTGTSWGTHETIEYPNQFRTNQLYGWRETERYTLLNTTHSGRFGKNLPVKVNFQVSLSSETPLVVSATEVSGIRRFHDEKIIGEYVGNGRYLVNEEALAAYHKRRGNK